MARVLVGVTGGIAAYKACELVRLFVKAGQKTPVVVAVRNVPGAKVSTVMSENRAGAYAATQHLAGLGHRRIAFLGGFSDTAVFEDRLAGYRQALRDGGIEPSDTLVVSSAPSRAGGVEAIGRAMLAAAAGGTATAASVSADATAWAAAT